MADLSEKINKNMIDTFLPTYGNTRALVPTWDEGQRMFICDEYESAAGHRYYSGIRFSDRIVMVEKVGLYHNWTYIDSIELYSFNGRKLKLIQKRDYNTAYRSEEFVRGESEDMVKDYLNGASKVTGMPALQVEMEAKRLIAGCYKSFLDSDYNTHLTQILQEIKPQILQEIKH